MGLAPFQHLFNPVEIGAVVLKNRIVMPPMSTNFGDPGRPGEVSERHKRYYVERAKGGAGLIIIESTNVNPLSSSRRYGLGLYDDAFIPGFKELAALVKEHGAKCGAQLNHGGRIGPMKVDFEGNYEESSLKEGQYYAATPLPHPVTGMVAKELTYEQLEGITGYFAAAAARAKRAGFDLVELHGAHGYLLNEFLSPYTNKRTDRFGGNLEGRSRFPLQVVKRVKDALGDEVVLSYRLSAAEFVDEGLSIEEVIYFARQLEAEGVQVLHVSAGLNETLSAMNRVIPPMSYPRGTLVQYSRRIKENIRIPVIVVQRINTPELAEQILAERGADLIATGRAFIADPHWPMKALEGRTDEIRRCVACNQGCMERVILEKSLSCLCNPEVGQEGLARPLPEKRKKIVVLGGGVAGMEAAYVLATRGHEVVLIEKKGRLGGSARLGSVPKPKMEFRGVVEFLETQLRKLSVRIALNQERLKQDRFDDMVIATGARPRFPKQSGVIRYQVLSAVEVLEREGAGLGEHVVVLGGGSVGIETAEYLRTLGKEVTVIEMLDRICGDLGPLNRVNLMERISDSGIKILLDTLVLELTEEGIRVLREGKEHMLGPPDSVVIAMGARALVPEPASMEGHVHYIGDCKKVGNAMDAIHGAFELANTL
jgi:2,4-dienoyl-CoA reductase-like NADH-dependent reductase (Old Yellow Enzyme family)/thioredoxin reductase